MAHRAAWVTALVLGLAPPALAQDCRLALVLALDVSSSVDEDEHRLQREGLARALVDPEVARLFLTGDPVAVYMFEWASPSLQEPVGPPWLLVESEDDLARLATALLTQPLPGTDTARRSTGLGAALIHALDALGTAGRCRARTVDVSGDGRSNVGFEPRYVYANFPFGGVTVNALVVGAGGGEATGQADGELALWFQSNVLHGRDAFWIAADGYEDFQRGMTAKLRRELTTPDVSGWPAGPDAG